MKKAPEKQLLEVVSETGDMYRTLGHHGPAVENEFMALRIYFNFKTAIDVYSKSKPGLELDEARWYTSPEQQLNGWGADYYKVGNTVGLGGLKLWDGENVVDLNPVTERKASVEKKDSSALIEMVSRGIPYRGQMVDILLRVTVRSGEREAKVEAISLSGDEVQFITGLNYHEGVETVWADNYLMTWGLHPEDVAAEKVEVGGAIMFTPSDFEKSIDDGTQKLLIAKPGKQLSWRISSANGKETSINNFTSFNQYIKGLVSKQFDINTCLSTYSEEKSQETASGHRFWFVDKHFVDGRTLKLSVVKPRQATHPPHAHAQDEFFFVLEGKAKFHLAGDEKTVEPYTSLYCPANMLHGISNAGETDLKYLVIKKYPLTNR